MAVKYDYAKREAEGEEQVQPQVPPVTPRDGGNKGAVVPTPAPTPATTRPEGERGASLKALLALRYPGDTTDFGGRLKGLLVLYMFTPSLLTVSTLMHRHAQVRHF